MKPLKSNIVNGQIIDHLLLCVNVSMNFDPGSQTLSDFYREIAAEFNRIADAEDALPEEQQGYNQVDSDLIETIGEY